MKIQNANYTNPGQAGNESARPVSSTSAFGVQKSGGPVAGARDQVQLSTVSQLLQTGSAQRAGKIALLSSLVKSGQYGVPAANVSQSLVSETIAQSGHR